MSSLHQQSKELKSYLEWSLAPKQLILTKIVSGAQEHVDHHMIEISLRTSAPFYDNEKR